MNQGVHSVCLSVSVCLGFLLLCEYLLYFWDRFVHSEEDTIGQDCQNDEQVEILIN